LSRITAINGRALSGEAGITIRESPRSYTTVGRAGRLATAFDTRRETCAAVHAGICHVVRCWEGVVYFSFVLDAYSRAIVGWQFAAHMRTDLVLDALRMALARRGSGADIALVHHSDVGSQYTSNDYTQTLDDHGVLASIGSVGDA
jgi:transposase InsO family protein